MKEYTTEEIQAILDEQAKLTADFRKKGDYGVNITMANRIKAESEEWREALNEGVQKYINSPDYVNPRGMLGKKRTEHAIQKTVEANSGKAKSVSHNEKVSEARTGTTLTDEAKQKLKDINTGKTTSKVRRVWTKEKGEFDKLKFAAKAFGVSPEAIKLWMKTKPDEFKFLTELPKAKRVHTDHGVFENVASVAKEHNITPQAVRYRIKRASWPNWYYLED